MIDEEPSDWNVLRTRSRQEKVVEKTLVQKQIFVYLPKLPRMSGGKKIETPLFPGYIFVKPNVDQLYSMNFIPGTCGMIMHRGQPGIVQERELRSIRQIVESNVPYDLHMGLLPGLLVSVTKGPLAGVQGELVRFKGSQRLVINALILGQAVSVELNAFDVVAV